MPEVSQTRLPTRVQSWIQKINFKLVLKWTTLSLLIGIIGRVVWSLVDELTTVSKIEKEIEEKDRDEIVEYQVSIWSNHVLYFSYILLAIYATIKENYRLLLAFSVVDLILDFIYIWDFDGILIFMLEISVTFICFITAVTFKYQQNIPWNPF